MNAMLESALARVVEECDSRALERDAKAISENYRLRTGTGKRLLTREGEAAAYAAARMPATCAAAEAALGAALMAYGGEIRSLLDVGAGTGAVSWAADALLPLERIICLEREEAMRSVGARLMRDAEGALGSAQWQEFDITSSDPLPHA